MSGSGKCSFNARNSSTRHQSWHESIRHQGIQHQPALKIRPEQRRNCAVPELGHFLDKISRPSLGSNSHPPRSWPAAGPRPYTGVLLTATSFRGFLNWLFSDSRWPTSDVTSFAMGSNAVSLRDAFRCGGRFGRWRGARATPVRADRLLAQAAIYDRQVRTVAMRRGSAVSVCRTW